MFDVIVIGDSVIDTYIPLIDAKLTKDSRGSVNICLPFGKKVPVDNAISSVAGNGANVSIGLSRLGLKTGIYTCLGNKDDEKLDDRIKRKLKDEGVDIRYIAEDEHLPSNHNIILTFEGERTILTHHQPWKYRLPDLELARFVYLTSLAESFEESALFEQIINYLERTQAKLIYQPGTFEIKFGVKKQARLLSLVELLIMNLEEAKLFLEISEGRKVNPKDLLKKLADLGPNKVIITNGAKGSLGFDGTYYYELGLFPAQLVEMTGAGDAYATGVTAGLIQKKELPEAMRWGAANSAAVVEEIGPQKGLLTSGGIDTKLAQSRNIQVQMI